MTAMRVPIVPALIVILVAIARLAPAQENEAEREKQERVADIFVALGVRDGAKVADLGSADGFYTVRLARAVGARGRAYAVDIEPKSLRSGGQLVIIEAIHEENRRLTREQQIKEHEIAPEIVESELREAGFEIVDRDDVFTRCTRPPPGGFWLIRARRP
jgi:predicted methyltransferase